MRVTVDELKVWLKERNEVLLSLDFDRIAAHLLKWSGYRLPKDNTGWAAIHKARTGIRDFPPEEKQKSKDWLTAHGFTHFDDENIK